MERMKDMSQCTYGKPTEMKVDTGAKCNVMSLDTFKRLNSGKQLVQQKRVASLVSLWTERYNHC